MLSIQDLFSEALLNGECCSQILMRVALDKMELRNEDLVRGMFGLCEGTRIGGTCGLVTAAACAFSLACTREDAIALTKEFTDWFADTYESTDCGVLTNGNPMSRLSFCRDMSLDALNYMAELLEWEDEDD